MFINDMFNEDSWSAGDNQWSSEHDQWTKESADVTPALTGVDENHEDSLEIGDEVLVTYRNQFQGKRGEITGFGRNKAFVIIEIDGKEYSMHSSDVERLSGDYEELDEYKGAHDKITFEIDSEKAYNHIMDKYGHVIDWDGDYMTVPARYWPAVQELAFAAGGDVHEIELSESGVKEGWKGAVAGAALGAAALAGIAHSPDTYVDGQQVQMAVPGNIPSDAKLVTDDNGNQIYVWQSFPAKNSPGNTNGQLVYRPAEKGSKVTRIQGKEYLIHSLPADMSKVKQVTDDSGKQVYTWVEKAGMRPQYTYYWFAPADTVKEGIKDKVAAGLTAAALATAPGTSNAFVGMPVPPNPQMKKQAVKQPDGSVILKTVKPTTKKEIKEGSSMQEVFNAITYRIEHQMPELFTDYGVEVVANAIRDVAEFYEGMDEIGSSDVGAMVRQVVRQLKQSELRKALDEVKKLSTQDKFEKHLAKHGYDVNEKQKYWEKKIKDIDAQIAAWDAEMAARKKGVAEGSETAADISKQIEFHKQGQASAQYKGAMNKAHAAKIRELTAKLDAMKKQDIKEGSGTEYRGFDIRASRDYETGKSVYWIYYRGKCTDWGAPTVDGAKKDIDKWIANGFFKPEVDEDTNKKPQKTHTNNCGYHYGHDCDCKGTLTHDNNCGYRYGHDCDCGLDRLKNKKQGVEEGLGKNIKRGLQGWYADATDINGEKMTPRAVVRRNKNYDNETLQRISKAVNGPGPGFPFSNAKTKHSPGDLQKRVIDREMKKRGLGEEGVAEAKSLNKRVRVVKTGETGTIRQVKHGAFKGAPKTYYVDLDNGKQADNLPASALRLIKDQGVAEGSEGQVVFSGTGANGSKYEIIQSDPYNFMIHANGKHIDTYPSLQRAMSVLKNEVPGLKQGVTERSPQSLGTALRNTLSRVEPGSKLDKKIRHHNDMVRRFGAEAGTMTSAPDGYHIDKKGFIRLGESVAEGTEDANFSKWMRQNYPGAAKSAETYAKAKKAYAQYLRNKYKDHPAYKEQGVTEAFMRGGDEDYEGDPDYEDRYEDEGFFVAIGNEERGMFLGMVTKDGGRWRETTITGNPPYRWGEANYMSYLTPQDVKQWINKDYGRHNEVEFFDSEEEARDYYGMMSEGVLDEASPMSSLGFPKDFISKIYQTANLQHSEQPVPLQGKPKAADFRDGVVIAKGRDGNMYAVRYADKNYGGKDSAIFYSWDHTNGTQGPTNTTFTKALAPMKAGTEFWKIPLQGYDKNRGNGELSRARGKNEELQYETLEYMNQVFLPKLKGRIEQYLDYIYANLRKLKSDKRFSYDSTEQERALGAAKVLQQIADNGFTKKTVEQFLGANNAYSSGWGSYYTNQENFAELMNTKPAARAEFAKMVFSSAKELYQSVKDMVQAPVTNALKDKAVAEGMGAYDNDKGIKHTRESLVAKLESLPRGDDDFEWNRIQAIQHLKQGNPLRARYYMAKMKRGEQGVAEGFLGDREYNRVMPFVKRIASEVSDYDRDEFGEELWSLLDQKYGSKFAQSVLDDIDFYWDTYTELTDQQGVAEGSETINIGDSVIIVGNSAYKGIPGRVIGFKEGKVVVDLAEHGKVRFVPERVKLYSSDEQGVAEGGEWDEYTGGAPFPDTDDLDTYGGEHDPDDLDESSGTEYRGFDIRASREYGTGEVVYWIYYRGRCTEHGSRTLNGAKKDVDYMIAAGFFNDPDEEARKKQHGLAEGDGTYTYYIVNSDTNKNVDGPFNSREEAEKVYDRMIARVNNGNMKKNFKIQKKQGVAEGEYDDPRFEPRKPDMSRKVDWDIEAQRNAPEEQEPAMTVTVRDAEGNVVLQFPSTGGYYGDVRTAKAKGFDTEAGDYDIKWQRDVAESNYWDKLQKERFLKEHKAAFSLLDELNEVFKDK